MLADGATPARGGLELAGGLACYRPYRCADGYVTLGALEPKFWQAFCHGVGREDLIERHLDPSGGETQREVEAIFAARTRDEWAAFAGEHDCCLEPVLDLDEALDSELVRAREMVVEIDQPGAERPVRLLGVPIKLSRTPGDPARAPGPGAGPGHARGARGARLLGRGDRGHARGGSGGRAGGRLGPWLVHGMKVFVPEDFPRGGLPDDVEFVEEGAEFAVPTSSAMAERLAGAARPPRRPGALRGHRLGRAPRAGRRDALQRRRHALAGRGAVGRRGDPARPRRLCARGRVGPLAAARDRGQARGDRRPRLDRARGRAAAGAVRRALRASSRGGRGRGSSRSSGSPTRSRAPTSSSCSRRSRTRRAG